MLLARYTKSLQSKLSSLIRGSLVPVFRRTISTAQHFQRLQSFTSSAPKRPFSTGKLVFTSNNVKPRQTFEELTTDFFRSVLKSTNFLAAFDSIAMEGCLTIFSENFFPESARQNIPNIMIEYLNSQKPSKTPGENFAFAHDLYRSFRNIIELLDKGNKGLLTGDLTSSLIVQLTKLLPNLITKLESLEAQQLPEHLQDEARTQAISDFYDDVCRVAFNHTLFRMPEKGIKFPDLENPRNLFERQLLLEDESNEIAIDKFMDVYNSLAKFGLSVNLRFARNYIVEWFPLLCKAIKTEQEECMMAGSEAKGDRRFYGPYLVRLNTEKTALMALTELMKAILKVLEKKKTRDESTGKPTTYQIINKVLFDAIGSSINMQVVYDFEEELLKEQQKTEGAATNNNPDPFDAPTKDGKPAKGAKPKKMSPSSLAKRALSLSQRVLKKKLDSEIYQNVGIPKDIQLKIAGVLVYFMKETIKVRTKEGNYQNLMTFAYSKVKYKPQYLGVMNVNEEFLMNLVTKAEKTESMFLHLERSLPMIFKPAPWQDYEIGGYYQKPTNLMRIQESQLQEKAIKYADLTQIYHVLNLLGETAWRINTKVLDVIEGIWEEGGGKGTIPVRQYDYGNHVFSYQLDECRNYQERQKLLKKVQAQRDIHSLRCDFSLKLDVARAFRNVSKIYFPHNVDFRGRIYPIPPHLNHIGADMCRGLLEFSEGKPIGKTGLAWLKVHCANKMGKDKLSFPDRIAYVEANMGIIEKCAKEPLKYKEWLEFEDCWQSLAAMFDLVAAMESRKPEEYISHIHIHQDGSCNGLQHYAALGRDYAGAQQVNLMNSERPGDIYTHVANMVQERVDKAAADPSSPHHEIAKKLVGNVKRKIVKQTVMTSVYGVTFIGARAQIYKQFKDKDYLANEEEEVAKAAYFVTTLTLDCIRDLFSGAHEIKKWLIQCAGLISQTSNPVSWTTPLGLPVVQPYRSKTQADVIQTLIQKVTLTSNSDLLPVNKTKQKSAFPPNYIHSLDSTHLMFTCVECRKENITFAAVHDSYWTHAGQIDRMNEILRDQFIRLHSMPLLENLKRSFEIRYPEIDFPPIPDRGDFKLHNIKDSVYFFA